MLVVIAIIGILVGLLMPAVQSARESARRMTCINNQKNLGIAMQAHHESKRKFPAAGVYTEKYNPRIHKYLEFPGQDLRDPNWGVTWVTQLLPFIEQQNMYDEYDTSKPAGDPANRSVVSLNIPLLVCPSAGELRPARFEEPATWYQQGGNVFGKGNYGVNTGGAFAHHSLDKDRNGDPYYGWANKKWRSPFAFRPSYGAKLSDFDDGASNTIIISEILGVDSESDSNDAADIRGCWGRVGGAVFSTVVGDSSDCARGGRIATPNCRGQQITPCFYDCPIFCNEGGTLPCRECPVAARGTGGGIAARSEHPGGVVVTFADGSTRFITDDVNPRTWVALTTMMGGEIVTDQ
jgi:type II secretory pathway pseudopilin PulG